MSIAERGTLTVSDIEAIANCKARYCAAADAAPNDSESARRGLAATMTDDCQGDYGFGVLAGPTAIADFMCQAIAGNSAWMLHMLHSPLIEVDRDRATAAWTVMVQVKRAGADTVDTVIGRYSDTFRKTGADWRIASVAFAQLT